MLGKHFLFEPVTLQRYKHGCNMQELWKRTRQPQNVANRRTTAQPLSKVVGLHVDSRGDTSNYKLRISSAASFDFFSQTGGFHWTKLFFLSKHSKYFNPVVSSAACFGNGHRAIHNILDDVVWNARLG